MQHKVAYYNTAHLMVGHSHGQQVKDLAVLHETISGDLPGLADIIGTENYLAGKDYGIHGMTDLEGLKAWALGMGTAIFYHAGGVNGRAVGIEQVSYIPALIETKKLTNEQGYQHWLARDKQLHATGQLLAGWHNADPKRHPLVYSNGEHPGVTSHWDVSQHHKESEGHWDCKPHHKGGHYPILIVIGYAKVYANQGYHF